MGSVRRKSGAVRVGLDSAEVVLLASLAGQVRAMLADDLPEDLADGSADPLDVLAVTRADVSPPHDPVMRRLLPDAYRDDPEPASEFRRLMDADVRIQKCAALQQVIDDLAGPGTSKGDERRFLLPEEAAERWLYALTDIRLALGTALGITEDMTEELESLEPGSQRFMQLGIYDFVTWLQDAIVRVVSGD